MDKQKSRLLSGLDWLIVSVEEDSIIDRAVKARHVVDL